MRETVRRARELRNNSTDAERLLWRSLRNSQLNGYKSTRQYPIGQFIVDFCCRYEYLIVEIDGGGHDTNRRYDKDRTGWLEKEGYRVIRFWNNDVLSNLDGVLETIAAHLSKRVAPPHDSRPTL